jgi:integrase
MTPRRRKTRVYWNHSRRWGDFRDYADVGGRREPLILLGERLATSDPDLAGTLARQRLSELRALRDRKRETGRQAAPTLAAFALEHLIAKRRAGKVTDGWIAATEGFLRRAVEFFGAERELDGIRPSDVRAFTEWLRTQPARKTSKSPTKRRRAPVRTMSVYTIRAHLFALSNLYRRAQESEQVPLGFNPVAALMEKPEVTRKEARWLEIDQAALYLESARTLPTIVTPSGEAIGAELAYPLVATFLLTGGRLTEVLGLELDDVSFDRQTVTFRPNSWRRLKTQTSWRVVPLWPQLDTILRAWVFGSRLERGGRLLFPSAAGGVEAMLVETRKLLDRHRPARRLEGGRNSSPDFPAYLCRDPPSDARSRCTGEPLHCESRTRPRVRGDGSPRLRPFRDSSAPIGVRGVPDRAAFREARRSADSVGVCHKSCHKSGARAGKRNPRQHGSASRGGSSGMGPARFERATSCSGGATSRLHSLMSADFPAIT